VGREELHASWDVDTVRAFYKTLSSEQLLDQYADYQRMAARARRRPQRTVRDAAYYEARARLMREELAGRGVEVCEPRVERFDVQAALRRAVRERKTGEGT